MTSARLADLIGAAVLSTVLVAANPAAAEQLQKIGAFEAHYSLVPTLFLKPEVAARYAISRGQDRALLNVSLIDPRSGPVQGSVQGGVTDLLGHARDLEFAEVVEGDAVYYLVTLRYDDREVLRFELNIVAPDGTRHLVKFQQKMYWEAP